MGFFWYYAKNPGTAAHKDEKFRRQSRVTLTATWGFYLLALIVFGFEAIGCIYPATRYFYIAEYQRLQFAFFGMCNVQGDVKCTSSLLKASYEVAAAIEAPESYVIDAMRLQNDTSFAPTALALFGGLIGAIWFSVFDNESGIQLYYTYWMDLTWWTAVVLAFCAAWAGTFSSLAIEHAQPIANKEMKRGIAYTVFYWVIFVAIVLAALAPIQWSADYSQAATLAQRAKWKTTYLDLIKPKDEITMKIINKADPKDSK